MDLETKAILEQIYHAALAAVDPYRSVKENISIGAGSLSLGQSEYVLSDIRDIYVIAAGKSAYGMARAAEDALGALISDGICVTSDRPKEKLARIRQLTGAHPVPNHSSVKAANEAMELARSAGGEDLVICLISGGASSLLALPAAGVLVEDKLRLTQSLLRSGADIAEINCVRKHISGIKGGRLAQAAMPARLVSLIMSDVIGDDPSVIASGPTAPDETTYAQAEDILRMRGVYDDAPTRIRNVLAEGRQGLRPETLKPAAPRPDALDPDTSGPDDRTAIDLVYNNVRNYVVSSNFYAVMKAVEVAEYLGWSSRILHGVLEGEASGAGRRIASEAFDAQRAADGQNVCLVAGGETVVTVKGFGLGGRNQETALSFAINLPPGMRVAALFAGTDGVDGPTEAAGAFVDDTTVSLAEELGMDPGHYLTENDSYSFFQTLEDHFIPGPTGTNVMDIAVILIK